jgi:1,4-alpha-glucan branching enzyme
MKNGTDRQQTMAARRARLAVPPDEQQRLVRGRHPDPHAVLGAHPHDDGTAIRAFHPDAIHAQCLIGDVVVDMVGLGDGLFGVDATAGDTLPPHRVRFHFADGATDERTDPYRFLPTVGDVDLHLFNEGTHRRLWEVLGSHTRTIDGVEGVSFAVWAPNAISVSVTGDFCRWDGRLFPMRRMGSSGVFELFIPELGSGVLYKYEIRTREGDIRLKTDPFAQAMELPPGGAARVHTSSWEWSDDDWLDRRTKGDITRQPMSIYEVHLGSWARVPEEGARSLSYREIAPRLAAHCRKLGFTHVELLPVAEHPFAGSWGYQVSGYYAPTARFGSPDDFRAFVDHMHGEGIGVILDWVPAHFPRDDFALRRFDGTALFEHEDPRLGEHPDWGTLIFNYGRSEVRNFLVANALYWLKEFHIDGMRVDAVASMLYLDYSRRAGEWIPNRYGGRENLDAITFLRQFNEAVRTDAPGCFTVAEESTAWPAVTRPVAEGGLGFTFKWNMGWMHDTLQYFSLDPIHRQHHHDQLTFGMIYEYTERFIMPLSHDEVVHGKGSLLNKMPGDRWQKFANLRLLFACMFTRPGKQLLFMGSEMAPDREWDHDGSLDWHLMGEPLRAGLVQFMRDLHKAYVETPCFWRTDTDPAAFAWIDCDDRANSVISWWRRDGEDIRVMVANFTPVPRSGYRVGAPRSGRWRTVLSTDEPRFGGSQFATRDEVETEARPWHRYPDSMVLDLPPLGLLVLAPS